MATLTANPIGMTLTSKAQRVTVMLTVISSSAWVAETECFWINIIPPYVGTTSSTLTLNIAGNSTGFQRTGTVTITGSSNTVIVTITQEL